MANALRKKSPGSLPEQIQTAVSHNHWIAFDTGAFPDLTVPCIVREKNGRLANYLPARVIQSVILNLFENLPEEVTELAPFRLIRCEPSELAWLNDINSQRAQIYAPQSFKRDQYLIYSEAFLGFYDRLKTQYVFKSQNVSHQAASNLPLKANKKDECMVRPLVVCSKIDIKTPPKSSVNKDQVNYLFYEKI
jgi:hypothetical protein